MSGAPLILEAHQRVAAGATRPAAPQLASPNPLIRHLTAHGDLSFLDAKLAETAADGDDTAIPDLLIARHGVARQTVAQAFADLTGARFVNPLTAPPDPALVAQVGVEWVLATRLLPWQRLGPSVIVLTETPEAFARARPVLQARYGDVRLAFTTSDLMDEYVGTVHAHTLAIAAEATVAPSESSRHWRASTAFRCLATLVALVGLAALWAPVTVFAVFCTLAVSVLAVNTALKAAALFASPSGYALPSLPDPPGRWPRISLLVPLHDETELADHLLARLAALDYPRDRLDVCLVLEASDATTRAAIGQARLPTWIRVVVVPSGHLKTKPRALNHALNFARGEIIGVYDAEDAPAVDQLRVVARHFAAASPDVACLQGTLDYYNPAANWLTRCFTIEYASWFRVILPGIARLGLVVPLGGTTLFFRRDILERLGAWDAHNVTEDADLGVRLARHGYRTEFIPTVTEEEANGHTWPWVKQRSRWLKGYAITYGVHMRRPAQLWSDLGAWRFFGVQMLFAGTLLQFVLAPVLWTFWALPLGLPHPLAGTVPTALLWTLGGYFLLSEVLNITVGIIASYRAGKPWLWKWTPTLQLYFPLAVIAAYKGLLELTWKPFYWEKTRHGVFKPPAPPPPRPEHRA